MFVVDTNVLVYAADENSADHVVCRDRIVAWREQVLPWYLTWGIVYEFLRVCTHPRVFRHPWSVDQAWSFVDSLLTAPSVGLLVPSERHAEVAALTLREIPGLRGNILHDTHTAVLMREHGIRRICTRDTDFHRFPFLEVVDPLVGD
jgi:uncharacterized protein